MARHRVQPQSNMHGLIAFTYANQAARLASIHTTDDTHKLAYQADTHEYFVLNSLLTWQSLGSGAGGMGDGGLFLAEATDTMSVGQAVRLRYDNGFVTQADLATPEFHERLCGIVEARDDGLADPIVAGTAIRVRVFGPLSVPLVSYTGEQVQGSDKVYLHPTEPGSLLTRSDWISLYGVGPGDTGGPDEAAEVRLLAHVSSVEQDGLTYHAIVCGSTLDEARVRVLARQEATPIAQQAVSDANIPQQITDGINNQVPGIVDLMRPLPVVAHDVWNAVVPLIGDPIPVCDLFLADARMITDVGAGNLPSTHPVLLNWWPGVGGKLTIINSRSNTISYAESPSRMTEYLPLIVPAVIHGTPGANAYIQGDDAYPIGLVGPYLQSFIQPEFNQTDLDNGLGGNTLGRNNQPINSAQGLGASLIVQSAYVNPEFITRTTIYIPPGSVVELVAGRSPVDMPTTGVSNRWNAPVWFLKSITPYSPQVADVVAADVIASEASGTYDHVLSVALTCATPNTTIYYSTDDFPPYIEYTGPITVDHTLTLRAKARGITPPTFTTVASDVFRFGYIINLNPM